MATYFVTFSAEQEAMIERYLQDSAAMPTQVTPDPPAPASLQDFVDAAIAMQISIVSHWDAQ